MAYTAIDDPEAYFQVKLYTGDGSTNAITLDGDTDMQPDMVWLKRRNGTAHHQLFDSVRGTTKKVYSSLSNEESTDATSLTAFGTDGFTLSTNAYINGDTDTFVAWCWKETATAGFDIVSYTGNGTDDTDISHNLSAVPHVIIVKRRDGGDGGGWNVYHHKNTSAPETDYLRLDLTNATADGDSRWSDESPTSSVFTLGTSGDVNDSSDAFISYLFSEKQGFSKFGSYTGNGDADGTFVYTGFRPAWLLIKQSSAAGNQWNLVDNKRDTDNPVSEYLLANTDGAEVTYVMLDFLSNGFKLRTTASNFNSASTYVYMAFAEAPFVNSKGVPCNAR